MKVKDKVVVVTGSGGFGSGRAIASRFAREGSFAIVSDINQEGGLDTVREIERQGAQAVFCRTDVRIDEQVRALIEFAERRCGAVSVLVNNASAPYRLLGMARGAARPVTAHKDDRQCVEYNAVLQFLQFGVWIDANL